MAQSAFKPATSPLVWKNNSIPYTTASHFPMPEVCKNSSEDDFNLHIGRNQLSSRIRHELINFPCHLQVKQGWDDFKHSPSCKQNHPLAVLITKLRCPRTTSLEGTARTLFHPVGVLYSYMTFPLPFHVCRCCAVHFPCNTTGLLRVFTSRRQFPDSRKIPSFCLEKKRRNGASED